MLPPRRRVFVGQREYPVHAVQRRCGGVSLRVQMRQQPGLVRDRSSQLFDLGPRNIKLVAQCNGTDSRCQVLARLGPTLQLFAHDRRLKYVGEGTELYRQTRGERVCSLTIWTYVKTCAGHAVRPPTVSADFGVCRRSNRPQQASKLPLSGLPDRMPKQCALQKLSRPSRSLRLRMRDDEPDLLD